MKHVHSPPEETSPHRAVVVASPGHSSGSLRSTRRWCFQPSRAWNPPQCRALGFTHRLATQVMQNDNVQRCGSTCLMTKNDSYMAIFSSTTGGWRRSPNPAAKKSLDARVDFLMARRGQCMSHFRNHPNWVIWSIYQVKHTGWLCSNNLTQTSMVSTSCFIQLISYQRANSKAQKRHATDSWPADRYIQILSTSFNLFGDDFFMLSCMYHVAYIGWCWWQAAIGCLVPVSTARHPRSAPGQLVSLSSLQSCIETAGKLNMTME